MFIKRVRVQGGAAGIELHSCPGARLRSISARNMRGPYPRGQCVQFSQSNGASLSNFYCRNDNVSSWPDWRLAGWMLCWLVGHSPGKLVAGRPTTTNLN